ncbi:MAG: hypothetical protein M3Y65_21760 [Pseudomonadota bacterium]|nr:hypothetical protein [Pseudomonadota bacterium]
MSGYLAPALAGGLGYLAPLSAPTGGDTTAPTLTAASATATGSTTATGSVTTNKAGGTLYFVAAIALPTVTAIKAGSAQAVSSSGAKSLAVSGLASNTTYRFYSLHRSAAGIDSDIAISAAFTTAAVGGTATYIRETFESRAGIPWTNLSGMRWYFFDQVWPASLQAPVAQGAVETTDSAAVGYFDIAGLTTLAPGQVGTLAYSNTNGDPDQADLMSSFTPVYVY